MRNSEFGMWNAEFGMGNGECGVRNAEFGMDFLYQLLASSWAMSYEQ